MRFFAIVLLIISGGSIAGAAEPLAADAFALRILDCEGLYTVSCGLKPVSDGFWETRFPEKHETSDEVDRARRILECMPLGPDLEAGVYVFFTPFKGQKIASAFVVHKPSLRRLIVRRKDVFDAIGIDVDTAPQRVMEKIDRAPRASRWRAFGLVFGYPKYAVDFFVEAGEQQAATKKFVERDFVQLPTFASEEGRFVYAVPKGHVERTEDRDLKSSTGEIFSRYRVWRSVYIGDGKSGAIELLKSWIAAPPNTAGYPYQISPCQNRLATIVRYRRLRCR